MVVGQLRANNWQIKSQVPIYFNLGKGYMNFMKSRLSYLHRRHEAVKNEMKSRKFKCDILSIKEEDGSEPFWNDWCPTRKDTDIIRARLISKLHAKANFTWWRWNRINLTKDTYNILLGHIINSEMFYV